MLQSSFQLKIFQTDKNCLFQLFWGKGQQLSATLPYPEDLIGQYQHWRDKYISFYKNQLRGRVETSGSFSTIDWHSELVEAEAKLLSHYHHWLRSPELYEIRTQIIQSAKQLAGQVYQTSPPTLATVDIFLACSPIELARLPWETWEIGQEFPNNVTIRFIRTPINIHQQTIQVPRNRHRIRILAILGDDTGLNFQAERQALQSLSSIAEIQWVGWQPGKAIPKLKDEIIQALTDEEGWDLLFFAGHSNETILTGGELSIAPNTSISIQEITPQLQIAQSKGLQFALFNSCSGLNIAETLIDMGLSQVAIMREPIHNQVAQVFLVRFLQVLADCKDVYEALSTACQYLKLDRKLTYPSAYLVPSLFCHPEATLFQLKPRGLKYWVKRWLPSQREAIAIGTLMILSLLSPVEKVLLERRVLVQAIYRDVTGQIPPASPSILLVQIDDNSIAKAGITQIKPFDRHYLASLIDKLATSKIEVLGIDYWFDSPQPENDPTLAHSIEKLLQKQGTWITFAAVLENNREVGVASQTGIAHLNQSMQGYANSYPQYLQLLPANTDCSQQCPFSYLLAASHTLKQNSHVQFNPQGDFRTQVSDTLKQNPNLTFLNNVRLHPLTSLSENFGQNWLKPINDFSIPYDSVYERLPAWKLLEQSDSKQPIVLIGAGGYKEAGITEGSDNFPCPLALGYWRGRLGSDLKAADVMTGSEALAYMVYQLLNQRSVIPVPNLWMLGIAVLLGKGFTLLSLKKRRRWLIVLAIATIIYGLIGLQVYISASILLPWLFPAVGFWMYVSPILRRKSNV